MVAMPSERPSRLVRRSQFEQSRFRTVDGVPARLVIFWQELTFRVITPSRVPARLVSPTHSEQSRYCTLAGTSARLVSSGHFLHTTAQVFFGICNLLKSVKRSSDRSKTPSIASRVPDSRRSCLLGTGIGGGFGCGRFSFTAAQMRPIAKNISTQRHVAQGPGPKSPPLGPLPLELLESFSERPTRYPVVNPRQNRDRDIGSLSLNGVVACLFLRCLLEKMKSLRLDRLDPRRNNRAIASQHLDFATNAKRVRLCRFAKRQLL